MAKQLWRIDNTLDSLLSRSLKARYFPKGSIWDAKVGSNPSYVWRSIWGSRSLLELGVRWRVGDGRSIKLWHEAWLGGEGSDKLITHVRILGPNETVDALMDQTNRHWRTDIIADVFLLIDADRISQIPISIENQADRRIWVASSDGVF